MIFQYNGARCDLQGGAGNASTGCQPARYSRRVAAANSVRPCSNTKQEKERSKLLSLIVAAVFSAVSVSALAAAHAGAADKGGKMEKSDKKAKGEKKAKAEKKKSDKKMDKK